MKKGTKVNIKGINKTGFVISANEKRVSVKMLDGTAKVFDLSQVEIYKKGGAVDKLEGISTSRLESEFKNEKQIFNGDIVERGQNKFKIVGDIFYIKTPNEDWLPFRKINRKYAKGGNADVENNEMVLNNNKQIKHHTEELPKAVKGKKVPAWVVAKVNRSASDLSDATHYMDGQGEKYEVGGTIDRNDNCIRAIVDMIDKNNKVKDFYIYDKKLVIVLEDELMLNSVEMANANLLAMKDCSHLTNDEFEMGYGEEYKTLILPLKTDEFTIGKFKRGGNFESKGFGDKKDLIGKKVKVDFRRGAIGEVIDYDDEWVTIDYPSLGFAEKVNIKTEQVTLLDKYAKGGNTETFNYSIGGL
jgi:hypothetical protein